MTFRGTLGATCDQQNELRVGWKVENFFSLPVEDDAFYESPFFQFLGRSFCLRIYPNGCNNNMRISEDWIGLFLRQIQEGPPVDVECTFGIKTLEKKIEERLNFISTFQERGMAGDYNFLKRSDLLFRRQELAPSDAVIFSVSIKTYVPRPVAESTSSEDEESDESDEDSDENRPLEKTGREKVAEDLGKLWSSSDNSDVIVKVGDVEFKVHRLILGARTPVFRSMFNHNTKEKESGVVTITDSQPEIFTEFLRYIYAGSPQELTARNAFGLYALAEKYMVDDLKTQCLRYIRNSLCVETFCDTALLALTYGVTELHEQADDFAAENIRLIIRSVEWRKFNEEHPGKATEILNKALGPHKIQKS